MIVEEFLKLIVIVLVNDVCVVFVEYIVGSV